MRIYLDCAASAPVNERALEAAMPFLAEHFGNPSSIHTEGRKAAMAIARARQQCAAAIGAPPDSICFTSGGTESDNLAVRSAALQGAESGRRHIVTTAIEHKAVLNSCRTLERQGFTVTYLLPDSEGIISAQEVERALRSDTALVSVMVANNEIGTIQPIADIAKLCRERNVLFHTDAVGAVGSIELDMEALGIDLLSCSAHKLGGIKGAGFLYCRPGLKLAPLIDGGGQERGLRGGTENTAAIVCMGEAVTDACRNIPKKQREISALRDELISLLGRVSGCRLNGSRERRLCGNVNVSFSGVEGESLILNLDLAGVSASSGSACAGVTSEPSHVLKAVGLSEEWLRGSLRLTLSEHNTQEEIHAAARIIEHTVTRLRGNLV